MIPRRGADAVQPVHLQARAGLKWLLFSGIGDFDDGDDARARRQFLQAAADCGNRRLVADKQVPIEIVGYDERSARPTDTEELSRPRLRPPARGRPLSV